MNEGRKARLRKFAIACCVVLVAFGIAGLAIHRESTGSVEQYKKQLRAAGEKLSIKELVPAPIPPERNGTGNIREALTLLESVVIPIETNYSLAMRMVAPGKSMVVWAQPDVPFDENGRSWEELEVAIQQRGGVLDLLQEIRSRPQLDFGLDYEKGAALLVLHLFPFKKSASLLSMATVSDLHHGDTGAAVTNLLTMLGMAKGFESEPLAISQLVRIAVIHIAFSANWELLQSPKTTDEQLALLQRSWADLEFAQAAERALLMERAMGQQTIQQLRISGNPYALLGTTPPAMTISGDWLETLHSVWSGTKRAVSQTMWKTSWSYTDELRMLQGYQVLIDATRQVQTNGYFKDAISETERRLKTLGFEKPPDAWEKFLDGIDEDGLRQIGSESVLSLERFAERSLIADSARQMAVAATALKRYQLRHGTYPSDLNALVPDFLPAVPLDPMDGKPIRFRLNTDGSFVLYCIGKDGKDDGGDTTPEAGTSNSFYAWQRNRDWVWPQPATVEEIKAYQEKRASR